MLLKRKYTGNNYDLSNHNSKTLKLHARGDCRRQVGWLPTASGVIADGNQGDCPRQVGWLPTAISTRQSTRQIKTRITKQNTKQQQGAHPPTATS